MSSLTWPPKDPDEVLDFIVDWADRIESDTISTSAWTVPSGITKNSDTHGDTTTTIWLSGGTLGDTYEFNNRIVTAGGRTMDQTVKLKIKTK
jgi:hypothetical protein